MIGAVKYTRQWAIRKQGGLRKPACPDHATEISFPLSVVNMKGANIGEQDQGSSSDPNRAGANQLQCTL